MASKNRGRANEGAVKSRRCWELESRGCFFLKPAPSGTAAITSRATCSCPGWEPILNTFPGKSCLGNPLHPAQMGNKAPKERLHFDPTGHTQISTHPSVVKAAVALVTPTRVCISLCQPFWVPAPLLSRPSCLEELPPQNIARCVPSGYGCSQSASRASFPHSLWLQGLSLLQSWKKN